MHGGNSSPYRSPCEGKAAPECFDSVRYRTKPSTTVTKYVNTTKVPDWRDPEDPDYNSDGIDPYAVKVPPASLPSCASGYDAGHGTQQTDPDTGFPIEPPFYVPGSPLVTNTYVEDGTLELGGCGVM